MPLKTYYKPNRTLPRPFSITDVARIYCKLVDDGIPAEIIDIAIEQKCGKREEEEEFELEVRQQNPQVVRIILNDEAVAIEEGLTILRGFLIEEKELLLGFLVAIGTIVALLRPLRAVLRRAPGANVLLAAIEREVIRTEKQIEALTRETSRVEEMAVLLNRARARNISLQQLEEILRL